MPALSSWRAFCVECFVQNTSTPTLRILVVAPDSLGVDASDSSNPSDTPAWEAERSRTLRIGLLENGYNIVAVLPADAMLPQRIAEIRPDKIGRAHV